MDYMGWGGGRICCSERHSYHHIDFGEVATGFERISSVQLSVCLGLVETRHGE